MATTRTLALLTATTGPSISTAGSLSEPARGSMVSVSEAVAASTGTDLGAALTVAGAGSMVEDAASMDAADAASMATDAVGLTAAHAAQPVMDSAAAQLDADRPVAGSTVAECHTAVVLTVAADTGK
jgi:hypothetical protein